jgi:hypothetical protein
MKTSKKFLIGFILLVILAIVIAVLCFKSEYIDRAENGLKYKTYSFVQENGDKAKIKLTEKGVTFIDLDFQETFENIATLKLAKDKGAEFNKLPAEEKAGEIDAMVREMISLNILQRNKEYRYTYNQKTGLLTFTIEGYQVSLSFGENMVVKFIPSLKDPYISFYGNIYK